MSTSSLRKSSTFYAGTILLAAFAVISILHTAGAQIHTAQRHMQLAQAQPQNSPAAPASAVAMSPEEQNLRAHSLDEPRAIAIAVVAADNPAPKYIVDNGAAQGQFLAVFLDKFPNARGQWTESDLPDHKLSDGKLLLGRFGDRVDYKLGCTYRDLTQGCVPKGTDVIITEWLSLHQNLDMMYKNYRAAFAQLPSGGWVVNIDHAGFGGSAWESRLQTAAHGFRPVHEGPPTEHRDFRVPTVDEQLGAMRAAGFDAQVVWQSFTMALFMGRKN